MSQRIAIATAAEFPDLDEDGPALLAALRERGCAAEPAVWTDESADWPAYDLVVVRSTWDYAPKRDQFVAWAHRVARVTRIANPAPVLEWNTDKTYLRSLAEAGIPVVPTAWLVPGDTFTPPESGEYVVKPAVSAGSQDTNRYHAGDHDELAAAHVQRLLEAGRTVMVQPYIADVDTLGETAMLFSGGRFSHAIRKGPLLTPAMGAFDGWYLQEQIQPREPSPAEQDLAERVLDSLAGLAPVRREDLTYARVDLLPGPDGSPIVIELELAEPSMFLVHDGADGAKAAAQLADAIVDTTQSGGFES